MHICEYEENVAESVRKTNFNHVLFVTCFYHFNLVSVAVSFFGAVCFFLFTLSYILLEIPLVLRDKLSWLFVRFSA